MTSSYYNSYIRALANRPTPIRETPEDTSEIEWQARWFSGACGRNFTTSDGNSVRILDFGEWNREAGPDFARATIHIAGREITGAIEVDLSPSGWEQHGHATNPDYNNVILHVFIHPARRRYFSRNALNQEVPQVCLADHSPQAAEWNPTANARPGRCIAPLQTLSSENLLGLLAAAAQRRFELKGRALETTIASRGLDAALYEALSITLGYKSNKLPFQLLAQRVPLPLASSPDGDAILFGVAGFLEQPSPPPGPALDITTNLWKSWWKQRATFAHSIIEPRAWRLAGIRPANHPLRRIAALHAIALNWKSIRHAIESANLSDLTNILSKLTHPFWSHHTSWKSSSRPAPLALLGPDRIRDIHANISLPLAFSRNHVPPEWENLPTSAPNATLEIITTRLFGTTRPSLPRKLHIQQALLQIYQDFCLQDHSSCEHCKFPELITNLPPTQSYTANLKGSKIS